MISIDQKKVIPGIAQRFRVQNNTFVADKIPDKARKAVIEIGDSKQDKFYPQFKTSHWVGEDGENEANLSVRLKDDDYDSGVLSARKVAAKGVQRDAVEWERAGRKARIYELDGFEDGGVEFEVELAARPESNVIDFTIETKGLDFFYQPEITDEEANNARGVEDERPLEEIKRSMRPENVVGSYAVYHKTGRNNRVGGKHYRTGKVFHIYRPHITDAAGNETWGELSIDEGAGILSVTVPEKFLAQAVYPVVADPTFGYTTIGGSNVSIADGMVGTYATAVEDGTVTMISAAVKVSTAGTRSVDAALYDGATRTYIQEVSGNATVNSTTHSWKDMTFVTEPSISNSTEYITVVRGQSASPSPGAAFDSASGRKADWVTSDVIDTSWTSPLTASVFNDFAISIYATYTAAPSATDTDDERAATTTGSLPANAARGASATGQAGAAAERDSSTHGRDTAADDRVAIAHGADESAAARAGSLAGADNAPAEREGQAHGQARATADRSGTTRGSDTAATTRSGELHARESASDEQSVTLHGEASEGASRPATLQGVDGTDAARAVSLHGTASDTAGRSAALTGSDDAIAARPAAIEGADGANGSREASTAGTDTSTAERPSSVIGSRDEAASRAATTKGRDVNAAERPGALVGIADDQEDRSLSLHGVDTGIATRPSSVAGTAFGSAGRAAELQGSANEQAERPGALVGEDTEATDRPAAASGQDDASAERAGALAGSEDVAGARSGVIDGVEDDYDVRAATIAGARSATATRGAAITGAPLDPYCPDPSPYSPIQSPYTDKTEVYEAYPPRQC